MAESTENKYEKTDLEASVAESTPPQPLIGFREMMADHAGVDDNHEEREEHLLPAAATVDRIPRDRISVSLYDPDLGFLRKREI